jgi:hypothetical protein
VASDVGGVIYVIPLDFGESSDSYFKDTDAIVIEEGQKIDEETSGAFKIGGADVDVEDGDDGSLQLTRDGEYPLYFASGRAGHFSAAFASKERWTIPSSQEKKDEALRQKSELRERRLKAKEEEKRREDAKKAASKKANTNKR